MTYGRPGVYVTERLLPAPLAATGTANAAGACVGKFAKGPTAVTLVTSWYDFTSKFGGYDIANPATFGVGLYFQNGGGELYVRRVLHAYTNFAEAFLVDSSENDVATINAVTPGTDGTNLRVQFTATGATHYYNLTVYRENGVDAGTTDDIILESFSNVRFDDVNSTDFIEAVVNGASPYITVAVTDGTKSPVTTVVPLVAPEGLTAAELDGGVVDAADYVDALADFDTIERPLVLFAPEIWRAISADQGDVHDGLISWAEANAGFAVLDTEADLSPSEATTYAELKATTSNAAVYYPNVYMADPKGRNSTSVRKVGPAGAVAGLYLSTDKQFGPFKSPAGLRSALGGITAIERKFTSAELDDLNSNLKPVNAIRDIPGAGVVVMGARTLKQDGTANRYVSMRRSLIHIRKQLEQITQFALFENNDERLWSRIRTAVSVFLNDYRNQGGLAGTAPADAFFVKCDRENNSASSIANGEVNIEVGVSLEYPAEFVVITLSQKTAV